MSTVDPPRPSFTRPTGDSAEGTPKVHPDPPSPEQARMIRVVSVVIAVGMVVLTAVGLLTDNWEILVAPWIMLLFFPAIGGRYIPREISDTFSYALRYAWIGDRAKRPRWVSEQDVERFAAQTRAQADAEAASMAARTRADAVPNWVRAGLPVDRAPRPDLLLPPAAQPPTNAEFTIRELDAIVRATGRPSLMPHSRCESTDEERAAQTKRLVARAVLRDGPEGIELAPEWLPLLGVARFATLCVSATWSDGGEIRWLAAMSVPGALVRVSPPNSTTDDPPPPESRHCLRASTPQELVDEVAAAHRAISVPQANGVENFMAISRTAYGPDRDDWKSWGATARMGGAFLVTNSVGNAAGTRELDAPAFRDWMLGLLNIPG